MARQGGQLKTLNVDPQPAPFDVDIGTSRTGALVAVYSRAIADENTDLFRYSFASDSETQEGIGYQAVHTRTLRTGKDRTIHVATTATAPPPAR